MSIRMRLLRVSASLAALASLYPTMSLGADLAPEFGLPVERAAAPVMAYTGEGTSAAKAVGTRFHLTADCTTGRVVDQAGRAFRVGGPANSAVEALRFVGRDIRGPVDQAFSDADLVSSYAALCPVGAVAATAAAAPGGGGGGTPARGATSSGGTTTVPSGTTTTITRRAPPVVVDSGGGPGPGGGGPTPGHAIGVPFPIAGAGLPAIIALGSYLLLRRRRSNAR